MVVYRRLASQLQGLTIVLRSSQLQVSPAITAHFCDMAGSVEASITKKLSETFKPQHLEVINESFMHNVPKGSETHFKVVVVSSEFQDLSLLKRHRAVNSSLQTELDSGVHALSIMAKTPEQWESSGHTVSQSPPCKGGAGL